MARVFYLFDAKVLVEILQLLCVFKGNNAVVPENKENRSANAAHYLVILRVGRHKHIKRAYGGLQPRLGYELDELRPAMRVPDTRLRQRIRLIQAEKSAVLLDDVALVHFTLASRTQ